MPSRPARHSSRPRAAVDRLSDRIWDRIWDGLWDRLPVRRFGRLLRWLPGAWALAAALGAALGAVLGAAAPASACPGSERFCTVEGGRYLLLLPEGVEATGTGATGTGARLPAMMYLHGWGASPQGVVNGRRQLVDGLAARGYALILPQGVARAGRTQRDWAVRDGRPHPRDDLRFLDAILADAATRGVDRRRVVLAGFSRGGSMVWDVACARPDMVRAYAPVAGAFWEPMPQRCAGPVDLFHTHGWGDRVVPLEGRPIGSAMMQGDAFASLDLMRHGQGCTASQPDAAAAGADLRWRRSWTSCRAGRLDLTLHPGGHVVPDDWLQSALTWFEARLADAAEPPTAGN
ncbi:MAG: dienelactone hydrolase family protein [Pseudomonadota bacterium]